MPRGTLNRPLRADSLSATCVGLPGTFFGQFAMLPEASKLVMTRARSRS